MHISNYDGAFREIGTHTTNYTSMFRLTGTHVADSEVDVKMRSGSKEIESGGKM